LWDEETGERLVSLIKNASRLGVSEETLYAEVSMGLFGKSRMEKNIDGLVLCYFNVREMMPILVTYGEHTIPREVHATITVMMSEFGGSSKEALLQASVALGNFLILWPPRFRKYPNLISCKLLCQLHVQ
jgi:hypothetical protein